MRLSGSKHKHSRSGFAGVSYDGRRGLWRVRLTVEGEQHWVGRFEDEREAAQVGAGLNAGLPATGVGF